MNTVTLAERSVVVLEPGDDRPNAVNTTTCTIGRELRFNRGALERCSSSPLDELDVDLLTVLASIAFTDRRTSRRRGRRWARALSVSIPVHRPRTWEDLASALSSLLFDVTGDQWRFVFRPRTSDDELRQLFMPVLTHEFRGATVIPYSGGLDSLSVLVRHRREHGGAPVLLVHAQHGGHSLRSVLPERDQAIPALAVPFTVSGGAHAEASYRSRTLVFFALAGLAWRRTDAARIWIGESGLGCIGPSLVPFGIEQPVRGCHPSFVGRVQSILESLWGARPPFEFPHIWLTKGEALREVRSSMSSSDWQRTRSCSRNVRRQHPTSTAVQCGLCSGCLFRRQSLLAAGMSEVPSTYYADVLRHAQLPDDAHLSDREVATYATISIDELAAAAANTGDHAGHVAELAVAQRRSRGAVAEDLSRLLGAHAVEWSNFVDALPVRSWMREILPSRERSR